MEQAQASTFKHFDRIDSLRGIAALMVAVYHSLGVIAIPGLGDAIWQRNFPQGNSLSESAARLFMVFTNGSAAVSLFFVMSGLVLGLSIDRWQGNVLRNCINFVIQRIFRIGPALWVTALSVSLFLIVYQASPEPLATGWFNSFYHTPVTLIVLLKNLTLTTGGVDADGWLNPVTWSLQVEMAISLLFPLLYVLNRQLRMRWHLPVVVALLAIPAIAKPGPVSFLNFLFMFYLGLMVPAWGAKLAMLVRTRALALGMFSVAAFVMLIAKGTGARPGIIMIMEAGGAFILLVAVLYGKDNAIFRCLDARIVRFYGRISYSFYLIDFPVLYIASVAALHLLPAHLIVTHALFINLLLAAVGVLVSTGLANLCYRWVELPGIRMGRLLTGKDRRTPAVTKPA